HIALGMQHATTRMPNLVHRDLKPGNILVSHDGLAKVTDFGLVRSLDSDKQTETSQDEIDDTTQGGDDRLTRHNTVVGTPPYMSPEQCRGERDVDKRADIYAFGIVLYELLTGQHPFKDRGTRDWRHMHLTAIPSFD